jgi:hypothetical protein
MNPDLVYVGGYHFRLTPRIVKSPPAPFAKGGIGGILSFQIDIQTIFSATFRFIGILNYSFILKENQCIEM